MKENIRLATKKDIDDIVKLHNSDLNLSGDDKMDFCEYEDIEDCIKDKLNKIFVYELDGKLIGILIAQFWTNYIYLRAIIVDKEHQGKGIGKKLMDYLEEKAKERDIPLIEAFTELNNKKMRKIFEKRGYRKGKTFLYYLKKLK